MAVSDGLPSRVHDKVRQWILGQGYPLEMLVARELEQQGFRVLQADFYQDHETGQEREIDVMAFAQRRLKEGFARFSLMIECKSCR